MELKGGDKYNGASVYLALPVAYNEMASAIIWNCFKSDQTETEKTFDYWVKKLYHDHKSRKGWGC